jgi:DNA-binding response OmpR family regulator
MDVNSTTLAPGRILLVDDEVNICSGLRSVLSRDGHEIRTASSAEEALTLLASYACEAAIVDICLPGMTGDEFLAVARHQRPHLAVLLLTGNGTLETAMAAVRAGACDYLLKPAQPQIIRQAVWKALATARERAQRAELLSSLRTVFQQLDGLQPLPGAATTPAANSYVTAGALTLDRNTHEVRCGAVITALTPSEFSILLTLAEHAGQVVAYGALAQASLGYATDPWEAKELVKRHILTLRQKLEPQPDQPQYIVNIRGIGYRLQT